MMACSAARSTSETRSFRLLCRTVSASRFSDPCTMTRLARRAAFTATLTIGCCTGIGIVPGEGVKAEARILAGEGIALGMRRATLRPRQIDAHLFGLIAA